MGIKYTKTPWMLYGDPELFKAGMMRIIAMEDNSDEPVTVGFVDVKKEKLVAAGNGTLMGIAPEMYEVIRRAAKGYSVKDDALELIERINKSATGKRSREI